MRWLPYRESPDDGKTWVWKLPIKFDRNYPRDEN
jgi:hypothetical protein